MILRAVICAAAWTAVAEARPADQHTRTLTYVATARAGTVTFRLPGLRTTHIHAASLRAGRVRAHVSLRTVRAAARRGVLRMRVPAKRRRWELRVVVATRPRQQPAPPAPPQPVETAAPPATTPNLAPVPDPPPPALPPAVTTRSATDIGLTSVTLVGSVTTAATAWFEWGTSTDYGHRAPASPAGDSTAVARVTGLAPGTNYHARLVASRCGDCPAAAGADVAFTTRRADTVPADGVLFGAWHGDPDATSHWNAGALLDFERKIGRRLAIDAHYVDWDEPFPGAPAAFDRLGGRLPLESWDYMGRLDAILDGSQDAVIAAAADRVRAYDAPILLRPWYEMNGDWWEGSYQGVFNHDPGTTNGPAKFVAAWRRLHDIFAQRGADNAVWVWSPNCSDSPAEDWNHWTNYYPGDAYVDWVSCDEYNWGRDWWASFRGLFGGTPSVYDDYPQKPFMIAETASCDVGGDKAAWIADLAQTIPSSFPRLHALVWFDEHVESECNWLVDSSAESLVAYRALGADPYFRATAALPEDGEAPDPPVAPRAARDRDQVRIDWTAPGQPDVALYRVYRRSGDGSWPAAATASTPAWTHTDRPPADAEPAAYRVTAVDAAGNESEPSATVSAEPR